MSQKHLSRLIELRKQQGYTQEQMAEKLGIQRLAYLKIENGDTALTIQRLYQILAILKLEFKDLFSANYDPSSIQKLVESKKNMVEILREEYERAQNELWERLTKEVELEDGRSEEV
jgi:transcriptional regulator with XRE-family HTH domain